MVILTISLNHELQVLAFCNPNSGVTCGVFLKILKLCDTFISGKDKVPLYG